MKKKLILGAFFGSALFSACNTARQVERHYQQYKAKNREVFAFDCSNNFPSVPTYKRGADSVTPGDTIYLPGPTIDCPPADASGKSSVDCPPSKIIHDTSIRVDTVTKPDAAKEQGLQMQSDRLRSEALIAKTHQTAAEQDRDKWKSLAQKRAWTIGGILGVLGLILGIGVFLKLKNIL